MHWEANDACLADRQAMSQSTIIIRQEQVRMNYFKTFSQHTTRKFSMELAMKIVKMVLVGLTTALLMSAMKIPAHAYQQDVIKYYDTYLESKESGKDEKAALYLKRTFSLLKAKFGSSAEGVLLYHLGSFYQALGHSIKAESVFVQSLEALSKNNNPQDPDVGNSLNELASYFAQRGRFDDAEQAYEAVLAIDLKTPIHYKTATTLGNIAIFYGNLGQFSKAEVAYKRALAFSKKMLGSNHSQVAHIMGNLAVLYGNMGDYDKQEALLRRAAKISTQNDSQELVKLANFYFGQRRFDLAVALYKRHVKEMEKGYGPSHPKTGWSLSNLAGAYRNQGRNAEAESLMKRALRIDEKAFGRFNMQVATSLNNLGSFYSDQGKYSKAEPLLRRSLKIYQKMLHPKHHDLRDIFRNLALLYARSGKYVDAERLYRRVLEINDSLFGPQNFSNGDIYFGLARVYFHQKKWRQSVRFGRRASDLYDLGNNGGKSLIFRSVEAEKWPFLTQIKSAYRVEGQPQIGHDMFLEAQKAIRSQASKAFDQMAARAMTGNKKLSGMIRRFQDLVGERSVLNAKFINAKSQTGKNSDVALENRISSRLSSIDGRISVLSKQLSDGFPSYLALASSKPLATSEVQKLLRPDEALVLLLDTEKLGPTPAETFVWVVTKEASRWVRSALGPKALKDHVDALRCGLDAEGTWKGSRCFDLLGVVYDQWSGKPLPFQLTRAHQLYKALFGKVEDLITGKDLLIVPSGPLTQLPFQVLVSKKPKQDKLTRDAFTNASWLARHHAITVLPSVSSLAALRDHAKASNARQPLIGFGNPLLDGHAASAKLARSIRGCAGAGKIQTAQLRKIRSAVMPLGRGARVADLQALRAASALPETADELCAVARNAGARNEDVHLGQRATETSVKTLSEAGTLAQFKVLHFATHGALAGELKGSNEPGLILSPPATATAKDDGYLSASEVAGLKLDADWVILSACNTAGGEAKSAEALSGLAKAFFYAGARSLLVSHWYVDSQATVGLITKVFALLKQHPNIGRSKALKLAMLSLQTTGKRTWHPAYWAPFVVVGEGG